MRYIYVLNINRCFSRTCLRWPLGSTLAIRFCWNTFTTMYWLNRFHSIDQKAFAHGFLACPPSFSKTILLPPPLQHFLNEGMWWEFIACIIIKTCANHMLCMPMSKSTSMHVYVPLFINKLLNCNKTSLPLNSLVQVYWPCWLHPLVIDRSSQ